MEYREEREYDERPTTPQPYRAVGQAAVIIGGHEDPVDDDPGTEPEQVSPPTATEGRHRAPDPEPNEFEWPVWGEAPPPSPPASGGGSGRVPPTEPPPAASAPDDEPDPSKPYQWPVWGQPPSVTQRLPGTEPLIPAPEEPPAPKQHFVDPEPTHVVGYRPSDEPTTSFDAPAQAVPPPADAAGALADSNDTTLELAVQPAPFDATISDQEVVDRLVARAAEHGIRLVAEEGGMRLVLSDPGDITDDLSERPALPEVSLADEARAAQVAARMQRYRQGTEAGRAAAASLTPETGEADATEPLEGTYLRPAEREDLETRREQGETGAIPQVDEDTLLRVLDGLRRWGGEGQADPTIRRHVRPDAPVHLTQADIDAAGGDRLAALGNALANQEEDEDQQ